MGVITFAKNVGEKQEMLRTALSDREVGDVFFIAWTGRWTTDIFNVSEKDIVDMIGEIGTRR